MKPRRIWTSVPVSVYDAFRERCFKQNLRVPDVFGDLVKAWAMSELDLPNNQRYDGGRNGKRSQR